MKSMKPRLPWALCLTWLWGLAGAQGGHTTKTVTVDIARQSMEAALDAFASQTGLQLLFQVDEVVTPALTAQRVAGILPPDEALHLLLRDSGLTFEFINPRTVAIRAAKSAASNSKMATGSTDADTAARRLADGSPAGTDISDTQKSLWSRFRMAQTTPGSSSDSSSVASQQTTQQNAEPEALQEIIVTSQRREESINKVPISMTALSQRTMDDLHIESLQDIATIVPGLSITTPTAQFSDGRDIAIRGIYPSGNAPTTQLYIDETPVAIRELPAALSSAPFPLIFDLDRVEVLRGPQGTLFGASAMGGAIRFITPQPNLESSSGVAKTDFSYTQGGAPNYEIAAAYGGPIVSDTLAFRVSAWFQALGGFIDQENYYTGDILQKNLNTSNNYVIRPAVTWAPTDALTITPAFFMQRRHAASPDGYWATELPNQSDGKAWGGIPQPSDDQLKVPSLAIKYKLHGVVFQSDTSYLDRKSSVIEDQTNAIQAQYSAGPSPNFPNESIPNPFLPGLESYRYYNDNQSYTHAFQQELRLSSDDPSAKVSWVLGAFYRSAIQGLSQLEPTLDPVIEALGYTHDEVYGGVPNVIYNGQVLSFFDNFHTVDVSKAMFADITAAITSNLKADAGIRVERVVLEDQDQVLGGPQVGFSYVNELKPDLSQTPVTPKFSLTYQLTDTDMVYASASKGFRPGGANLTVFYDSNSSCAPSLKALGLQAIPANFNSDSLWSYEVGTKDMLFDRRLAIQGSAFYVKWSDAQSGVAVPSCNGSFTANEGRIVSQGFDLQLAAVLTSNLKLNALVGYTDAYYPDSEYTVAYNGVSTLVHPAGTKFGGADPWTADLNGEYSQDLAMWSTGSKGYVRMDFRWLSSPYTSNNPALPGYDPEAAQYPTQAYGLLNLRLGITHAGWDLSAYVNNLTDSDPRLGFVHDTFNSPLFYASALRPRTFGLTAWYRL